MNITAIIAMLLIAMLAVVAIVNHIDGVILASAFTIIGGLGGYAIGKKRLPK